MNNLGYFFVKMEQLNDPTRVFGQRKFIRPAGFDSDIAIGIFRTSKTGSQFVTCDFSTGALLTAGVNKMAAVANADKYLVAMTQEKYDLLIVRKMEKINADIESPMAVQIKKEKTDAQKK